MPLQQLYSKLVLPGGLAPLPHAAVPSSVIAHVQAFLFSCHIAMQSARLKKLRRDGETSCEVDGASPLGRNSALPFSGTHDVYRVQVSELCEGIVGRSEIY